MRRPMTLEAGKSDEMDPAILGQYSLRQKLFVHLYRHHKGFDSSGLIDLEAPPDIHSP